MITFCVRDIAGGGRERVYATLGEAESNAREFEQIEVRFGVPTEVTVENDSDDSLWPWQRYQERHKGTWGAR